MLANSSSPFAQALWVGFPALGLYCAKVTKSCIRQSPQKTVVGGGYRNYYTVDLWQIL